MGNADGLSGTALVAGPEGAFRMAEVVTSPIGEDDIGIQALWSGVSIGTEFAVLNREAGLGRVPDRDRLYGHRHGRGGGGER